MALKLSDTSLRTKKEKRYKHYTPLYQKIFPEIMHHACKRLNGNLRLNFHKAEIFRRRTFEKNESLKL